MPTVAANSPLLQLNGTCARAKVYLKLESLNPTGSFKLRGASHALTMAPAEQVEQGVYTASSGNMAQALAWSAAQEGIECTVVIPDSSPSIKRQAIRQFGAQIIEVPFAEWWQMLLKQHYEPLQHKLFVHPSSDKHLMVGYAAIALEILEEVPNVDAILIPWGSGGLCCGIGSIFRAIRPEAQVFACEVNTGAPLAASFAADAPTEMMYTPTFIDGISSPSIMPEM